jgi:hypothetical protein
MSASGFTPIQLFRTSTASAIPSAGTLADGELAINLTDERLYFKNAAGVVKLLASNAGSLGTVTSVAASGGTTGLTFSGSPITTSGTLTLGGTLAVANGGTGVTTSTGSVSVVLSKSPTLETPILGAATATSIANGLGAVGTPSYTFVGDLNTGMWSPAADTVAFSTNGAERMRFDSSGNVGIGTVTPGVRLDVNAGPLGGTAGNTLDLSRFFGQTGGNQRALTTTLVRNSNGSDWTTTTLRLQAVVDTTSSTYVDFSPNGTHDLAFGSLGSERMRITSAGNVGIGTTSPGTALDVAGDAVRVTRAAANAAFLGRQSNGTLASPTATTSGDQIVVLAGSGYNGSAYTTTPSAAMRYLALENFTATANGAAITFETTPIGSSPAARAERMRIDGSGNVGIGTTSPQQTAAGRTVVGVNGSSSSLINIGSGGNFGSYWFWDGTTATLAANNSLSLLAGASPILFNNSGVERMRIDGNGNVGIGTASPAARLDLNGNTAQNIVAVAALDVDCTLGNFFTKTIAANSTFTFSNPPASRAYAFTLEIVHTSGTITWPTTVRWPGNTAPTLTTGRTHLITFVTDNGGTIWYGAPQTNYLV